MIGRLRGIAEKIDSGYSIIDVSGVGYLVYASARSLGEMSVGSPVTVHVETHVREDHIHLYGFTTEDERGWFRILTTVKGVGPKVALAILSILSPIQLSTALLSQDKKAFGQVSGIGPKLAERIITELKDKASFEGISVSSEKISAAKGDGGKERNNSAMDAISALTNLGYGRSSAYEVVMKIASEDINVSVEELIRKSLKELV